MNITVEKTLKNPLPFVANQTLFVSQDIFNLRGGQTREGENGEGESIINQGTAIIGGNYVTYL